MFANMMNGSSKVNFSMIPTSTQRLYGSGSSGAIDKLKEEGKFIGVRNDMKIYENGGRKYGVTKGGMIVEMSSFSHDSELSVHKDNYEAFWMQNKPDSSSMRAAKAYLMILKDDPNKSIAGWANEELAELGAVEDSKMSVKNKVYDKNQMAMGIDIEKEHKPTYEMIEDYYTKNGRMPPAVNVYQAISENHLDEFPTYYTYLKKMEKEAGG